MTEAAAQRNDRADYQVAAVVDDELFANRLSRMLNSLTVVRNADVRKPAPSMFAGQEPDVLILSVGDLEPEVAHRLAQDAWRRGVKVLLLLGADERLLDRAAAIPSNGFLMKAGLTSEDLARALNEIAVGDIPIPPPLAERLLDRFRKSMRRVPGRKQNVGFGRRPAVVSGWESLTEAEARVVRVIAEGLTNRKAADRLFLSPHTVDSHLRHVFYKLGLNSRVQLTREFMDCGRHFFSGGRGQ